MIRSSIFLFLVALVSFSCTNENGVPVSKPSTFIRYYNGGNFDDAQAMIETSDKGFMILANTQIGNNSKIKLIKTDVYGNQLSQNFFPDFGSAGNFKGYALVANNSSSETGYVIVGEDIHAYTSNNTSKTYSNLLVISVDLNGVATKTTIMPVPFQNKKYKVSLSDSISVQGVGIVKGNDATVSNGDYFIVGQMTNTSTGNMLLTELNKTTLDTLWTRSYGAGQSSLAARLFMDPTQASVYWGGTTVKVTPARDQVRFAKSGFNSQSTLFDITFGQDTSYLDIRDICQHGFNYVLVGSSGKSSGSYNSIFYVTMRQDGIASMTKSFSIPLVSKGISSAQTTFAPASSVCSTNDAGLLLLGTVAVDAAETDLDYYLIKVDMNGGLKWTKQFGSRFIDKGKQVLQASDGGYMILGTTTLANVPSIFLAKTDLNGNIQ